jgi:hypothetical protein
VLPASSPSVPIGPRRGRPIHRHDRQSSCYHRMSKAFRARRPASSRIDAQQKHAYLKSGAIHQALGLCPPRTGRRVKTGENLKPANGEDSPAAQRLRPMRFAPRQPLKAGHRFAVTPAIARRISSSMRVLDSGLRRSPKRRVGGAGGRNGTFGSSRGATRRVKRFPRWRGATGCHQTCLAP